MKKFFLSLFCQAAVLAGIASGPQLELAHREIDLGVFDADSVQSAQFSVRNTGTDTLHIFRVHTDCRCTRPSGYDHTVAPGDSTTICISYNGAGHSPGRIRQAVRLRTNAPEPYITCYITGQIRRPDRR